VRWKHAAMDAIDRVDDARQREVLELYYLDGYTWEQVAHRMELDPRWVFRLHGKALLRVKVLDEFDH
ncbi:MAG: RNA polymerase subunit sigma-70, partial [Oscillospiraceae bacterium]|nr:RNA polymerase subunit sigma-70 [Oscillospiraceae bacterium]